MLLAPKQPHEMAAAHRAAAPRSAQPRALRNLRPVLELGNTTYVTFRGRAYGVPPLPWRDGQRLMALWIQALQFPGPLTAETHPKYYAIIQQLPALLWSLCRPVGLLPRLARRLGLHRNPFRQATEQELAELASLFLQRRMRSSIQLGPSPARPIGTAT